MWCHIFIQYDFNDTFKHHWHIQLHICVSLSIVFISFCDFLERCNAHKNDANCCTPEKPCGAGEGDCDSDSDCAGNLKCGTKNCKFANSAWSDDFDCCITGKKKYSIADK